MTISTAAAMMVWAFFGNVLLQNVVLEATEKAMTRSTEPSGDPSTAPSMELPPPERFVSYDELRELNRRHRGAIKLCYMHAARRFQLQQSVPSRVDVTLKLTNGTMAVSVESVDPKLATCIQRVVQQYRFADDLSDQTVTFPLILAR